MFKHAFVVIVAGLLVGFGIAAAQDATPPPPPNCPAFENEPANIRTGYYMGEGIAYLNTNQLSAAELSFTCIIRVVDAAYVPAYMGRAIVYTRLRDFERAQEDYNQALQRDSTLTAAYNNRGVVFALQLDYERAADDFDRALAQDSGYLRALNNRAIVHTFLREYDEAIALLEGTINSTGVDNVLAQYRDPERAQDAPAIPFDPLAGRLYALLGTVYSARSLDNYRQYIDLYGFGGLFPDERITAAAGALESRFTFELRLDDGSWLLLDETLTSGS
jgi:tetratricopeptide (TPR) repeat protein